MNTSEIIKSTCRSWGYDEQKANAFVIALSDFVKSGEVTLMRESETVIIFKYLDEESVEFHIFTVDQPMALANAMSKMYEAFKSSNIKYGESTTDNPAIIKLAQRVGIPIQAHKLGDRYQVEIEVQ